MVRLGLATQGPDRENRVIGNLTWARGGKRLGNEKLEWTSLLYTPLAYNMLCTLLA
jgi:hypothetical protein